MKLVIVFFFFWCCEGVVVAELRKRMREEKEGEVMRLGFYKKEERMRMEWIGRFGNCENQTRWDE